MTVLWWQNTSQNPNTPPRFQKHFQEYENTSQNPKKHFRNQILGCVLDSVFCKLVLYMAKLESLTQVNLITMNRAKT